MDTRHPIGYALGYGGKGGVEGFTGLAIRVGNVKLAVVTQSKDLAAYYRELLLQLAFVRLLHDQDQLGLLAQKTADLLRAVCADVKPVGSSHLDGQGVCALPHQRTQTSRPDRGARQVTRQQHLRQRAAADVADTDGEDVLQGLTALTVSRVRMTADALGKIRLMTRFQLTRGTGSTKTTSRAFSSKPSASA